MGVALIGSHFIGGLASMLRTWGYVVSMYSTFMFIAEFGCLISLSEGHTAMQAPPGIHPRTRHDVG